MSGGRTTRSRGRRRSAPRAGLPFDEAVLRALGEAIRAVGTIEHTFLGRRCEMGSKHNDNDHAHDE